MTIDMDRRFGLLKVNFPIFIGHTGAMIAINKRLLGIILAVPALLLIPLIAGRFSSEVQWSPFDFVVAGGLLLGTGLLSEIAIRQVRRRSHRILIVMLILLAFLLIWIDLAVGIFGLPTSGS